MKIWLWKKKVSDKLELFLLLKQRILQEDTLQMSQVMFLLLIKYMELLKKHTLDKKSMMMKILLWEKEDSNKQEEFQIQILKLIQIEDTLLTNQAID